MKRKSFKEWIVFNHNTEEAIYDLIENRTYTDAEAVVLNTTAFEGDKKKGVPPLSPLDPSWKWTKAIVALKMRDPNTWAIENYGDDKEKPLAYKWIQAKESLSGLEKLDVSSSACWLCDGSGSIENVIRRENIDKSLVQSILKNKRPSQKTEPTIAIPKLSDLPAKERKRIKALPLEQRKKALIDYAARSQKTEWLDFLTKRQQLQIEAKKEPGATKKKKETKPIEKSFMDNPELKTIFDDLPETEQKRIIKRNEKGEFIIPPDAQIEILKLYKKSAEEQERRTPRNPLPSPKDTHHPDPERQWDTKPTDHICPRCNNTGRDKETPNLLCGESRGGFCYTCPMCKGTGRAPGRWYWHNTPKYGTLVSKKRALIMELNKQKVEPPMQDVYWMFPSADFDEEDNINDTSNSDLRDISRRVPLKSWPALEEEAKKQMKTNYLYCPKCGARKPLEANMSQFLSPSSQFEKCSVCAEKEKARAKERGGRIRPENIPSLELFGNPAGAGEPIEWDKKTIDVKNPRHITKKAISDKPILTKDPQTDRTIASISPYSRLEKASKPYNVEPELRQGSWPKPGEKFPGTMTAFSKDTTTEPVIKTDDETGRPLYLCTRCQLINASIKSMRPEELRDPYVSILGDVNHYHDDRESLMTCYQKLRLLRLLPHGFEEAERDAGPNGSRTCIQRVMSCGHEVFLQNEIARQPLAIIKIMQQLFSNEKEGDIKQDLRGSLILAIPVQKKLSIRTPADAGGSKNSWQAPSDRVVVDKDSATILDPNLKPIGQTKEIDD